MQAIIKGGKIFNQILHVGRISDPVFQNGEAPITPSMLELTDTSSGSSIAMVRATWSPAANRG